MTRHKSVLALGVFDLFHIGHLRYLQYARSQGQQLSVAISTDAIVRSVKSKQCIIPEGQRAEIIRGLGWVDVVRLQPCSSEKTHEAAQWMQAWGIDHVVSGGGWQGSERWNRLIPALAERGISVSFAPQTDAISTTQIIAAIQHSASDNNKK
jgi:glycerol-3-phosphate cytidylyltransferase